MKKFSSKWPFRRVSISPLLLLLVAVLLVRSIEAQGAAPKTQTGRLVDLKISFSSLKGNLLGDPVEQKVTVYLPPGYDGSTAIRYPSLYLLHGFGGKVEDFTRDGYQEMNLQPMMDGMIKSGAIKEMIVVVPNGTNAYKGSFYTNSSVAGNWEDMIFRDLTSYIDGNYRTLARPESRGIAGHSMGGYAAIVMGMKHPDVFGAIYALSPCCLGLEGDFGADNPAWAKALKVTSPDVFKKPPQNYEDFWTIVFLAISASFTPEPKQAPLYLNFPYKEVDGRMMPNEPAFSQFRSKMPLYQVEQYRESLLKLRGIYLDYGQNEEFSHIRIATRKFSDELTDRAIPHTFEIYKDGDHGSKIRERMETRVLQFFSNRLSFGP